MYHALYHDLSVTRERVCQVHRAPSTVHRPCTEQRVVRGGFSHGT